MDGLVDNREELPEQTQLDLDAATAHITRAEAEAPRQVKVCFTPLQRGTLVTVVTQEWNGRLRLETRVAAVRIPSPDRLGWAIAPHEALAAAIAGLAAYLEA